MDIGVPDRISNDLYDCFSYMRSTFEGILACNNPNVWNVFGGLNRAKKATYNIITHELRTKNGFEDTENDTIKILCNSLLVKFPCGNINTEDGHVNDILLLWIENHLLDHSLFKCLKCAFLQNDDEVLNLYKEFSFVKNESLLNAFLICLDSLQHMELLSQINPILMNRATFLAEISPWVSIKMTEEYKICQSPIDRELKEWDSTLHAPAIESRCEKCKQILALSEEKLYFCRECNNNRQTSEHSIEQSRIRRQQSFSKDILLKSALSAVMESNQENSTWYNEDEGDLNGYAEDLRTRLTRMKELSRSESSLFQEAGHVQSTPSDYLDGDMTVHDDDVSNTEIACAVSITSTASTPTLMKKRGHHRSKSDQIGVHFNVSDDELEGTRTLLQPLATSLPQEVTYMGQSSNNYYYQSEDGQLFPKPYKGQSLISYLDSRSYDTGAQLDKENAHFSICEALITAIEQMRCQSVSTDSNENNSDDDVPESRCKQLRKHKQATTAFSDRSDTGKTSSTLSSSYGSSNNTDETRTTIDSPSLVERGLTISASWENVSLAVGNTSHAENKKKDDADKIEVIQQEEIIPDDSSAEAVAKSLLKKFDGRSIPAASELKWMVSEDEAPQQLLPLPTAWPVAPDAHLHDRNEYGVEEGLRKVSMPSLLRGNLEWAPPRPQIIFSPHPFVKRKVLLHRQHFRCAGCGLKVSPNLSKRFRFCEYIGKYFCTSCHQNKLSIIPSKILSKWDFKKYPVSDFAKELIKKIYRDPLFNVLDVSPTLYDNIRQLSVTKKLRTQLHYIKHFLRTCRHAESTQKEVFKLPMHIADDPDAYSLDDLVQVKTGELLTMLKAIVLNAIRHVKEDCPLCSAKGFVCEFCRVGQDILYPFELQKVHICSDCKTCFHRSCYVPEKCPRCARIKARQEMLKQPDLP